MQSLTLQNLIPYLEAYYPWLQKRMSELDAPRVVALYQDLILHLSQAHTLHFATTFSRLSFLIDHYNIPSKLAWQLHYLRVTAGKEDELPDANKGVKVILNFLACILQYSPAYSYNELFARKETNHQKQYIGSKFGLILAIESDKLTVVIEGQDVSHQTLIVQNTQTLQKKVLSQLMRLEVLPIEVRFKKLKRNEENLLSCENIILQPHFLIDVSTLASCVDPVGYDVERYIINKLMPRSSSPALLLGNVVNLLFDELNFDPNLDFNEFTKRLFGIFPLELSMFSDRELRDFIGKLRNQFFVLKDQFLLKAKEEGLKSTQCYVEPSFLSPEYGLQGRLDALYEATDRSEPNKIVELKSGKVFRPNRYGLNHSHYAQTILYECLTEAALKDRGSRTINYILYSKAHDSPLRYAPSTQSMIHDLIHLRNQIVLYEYQNQSRLGWLNSIKRLFTEEKKEIKGFHAQNYKFIKETFKNLRPYEKDYLLEQLAFLSREMMHQKIGGNDQRSGQSSLWNWTKSEKLEQFLLLDDLEISKDNSQASIPTIELSIPKDHKRIHSFRAGDLVLLHPQSDSHNIAHQQVIKGTITDLNDSIVQIQLRAKQRNPNAFSADNWQLEPDYLDTGLRRNMSNILSFLSQPEEIRSLFLTPNVALIRQAPEQLESKVNFEGTDEQRSILNKYIQSEKLFILWGPPGTGKTSVMLRQMVAYYLSRSDDRLLLSGYTNRSVDEICESILPLLSDRSQLLRIGSRYGTRETFRDLLLQSRVPQHNKRNKLREHLANARVMVGTIASLDGKSELFKLVKFDRMIIDEASQILDGQLLGMVRHSPHICLIGDHHQLPAVVAQDSKNHSYQSDRLRSHGFLNLSDSLFHRIFNQLKSAHLDKHFAMLSYQGRMHEDIGRFVSEQFYLGALQTLPKQWDAQNRLRRKLEWTSSQSYKNHELNKNRIVFVKLNQPKFMGINKSNIDEAEIVIHILDELNTILADYSQSLRIGVICPFKAQIACIIQLLAQKELQINPIVDTVERFQGASLDIAILSTVVRSENGLNMIINQNENGIDRKLNVALSRAKEQLIMIGNENVLINSKNYREYIYISKKYKIPSYS